MISSSLFFQLVALIASAKHERSSVGALHGMENVEVASMAMAKKINGEDGLLAAIAATGSSVQAANGRLPEIVELIASNAEMCTRYATEFEITEAATRSRIAPIADLVETVYLLLPRVSHAFAELSAGGDARTYTRTVLTSSSIDLSIKYLIIYVTPLRLLT